MKSDHPGQTHNILPLALETFSFLRSIAQPLALILKCKVARKTSSSKFFRARRRLFAGPALRVD